MNFPISEINENVTAISIPKRFTVEVASEFKDVLNELVSNQKYKYVII